MGRAPTFASPTEVRSIAPGPLSGRVGRGSPRSVGQRPRGAFGAGFPTVDAGLAGLLGLQRQEPDRGFGIGLDLRLAIGVSAPGSLEESTAGRDHLLELLVALRRERVGLSEIHRVAE